MNLQPGQEFGPYVVGRPLGSGTMGVVYEATDTRLGRPVALKLIHPELSRSDEFKTRLAQEARRAALIDSPYVLKVWELGEFDGALYVSLEYVAGLTLREAAADLPLDARLDIAVQLATGLGAAHAAGVVHRDLKPENIKLTGSGEARILDFGLAIVNRGEVYNASGDIEGTVAYCSPEQLSGGTITAASDLFSLGVVLYELFTGRRPFMAGYSAAIIYSILYEEPSGPQEINRALPYWLNDLILALLQKSPADRPADAGTVARIIAEKRRSETLAGERPLGLARRRAVTIEDLRNVSSDPTWDNFCEAFSQDLIGRLVQRTELTVSAAPSQAGAHDMRERFERYRCDFLVTGSLARWETSIRLSLSIHADGGTKLVSRSEFKGTSEELFTLLSTAVDDTSETLSAITGTAPQAQPETVAPDVTAYDFYIKGRSYYQTNRPGDLKRAEELFRRAIAVDPQFALAHTGLSDVYTFQYMAYYDRRPERIGAARDEALRALDIAPDMPEAYRSLGRYYMFTGDLTRAEEAFLQSVRRNPKYAVGFRTLAWLKSIQGELDAALGWATKALRLAPTDLETLLLISLVHMDRREFTPAMATLRRAIELGPDYGRAFYNLGTVYMRLGLPRPALENFLHAIEFMGDPNAFVDAGYACIVLADLSAARKHLEDGIAADQMPFICHYYLGRLDKIEGMSDSARSHFETALRLVDTTDTGLPDNHLRAYQSALLAELGDIDNALVILDELSRCEGLTGDDLYCIARAYASLGQLDAAQRAVKAATAASDGPTEVEVRLDPFLADILF